MHTINFVAYLIGSFPTGVLVGKLPSTTRISGIIGRTISGPPTPSGPGAPKAGTLVFLVDFFKGTLATCLPRIFHLGDHHLCLIFGAAAIFGHAFSIFLKFKGGKAVATTAGFLLGYNVQFFGLCAFYFILLLLITSMVSLSSLISVVLIFISSFFHDTFLTVMSGVLVVLIWWSHRANIKRIIAGNENLVPFGLYYHIKQKQDKDKKE